MKKAKAKSSYLKEIILILSFIIFSILSFLCFKKSIIIQKEQVFFSVWKVSAGRDFPPFSPPAPSGNED